MTFDIDEYLGKKTVEPVAKPKVSGFNIDEYLGKKKGFDIDTYLSEKPTGGIPKEMVGKGMLPQTVTPPVTMTWTPPGAQLPQTTIRPAGAYQRPGEMPVPAMVGRELKPEEAERITERYRKSSFEEFKDKFPGAYQAIQNENIFMDLVALGIGTGGFAQGSKVFGNIITKKYPQIAEAVSKSPKIFNAIKNIVSGGAIFATKPEPSEYPEEMRTTAVQRGLMGAGTIGAFEMAIPALGAIGKAYIKPMIDTIKRVEPDVVKYQLGELKISENDLKEQYGFFDKVKEWGKGTAESVRNTIRMTRMSHNYLFSNPESKPVAEGVIDVQAKMIGKQAEINEAMLNAKRADNPDLIADILTRADRQHIDIIPEVIKLGQEGKLTANDVAAFDGIHRLRNITKRQLTEEILAGRLGTRIKSNGMRYMVDQNWVTEAQAQKLMYRYPSLKVQGTMEEVVLKRVDPETGKYITEKRMVKDFDEAVTLAVGRDQKLIDELLPYENWIAHNRKGGKYWVEVTDETGKKVFSARVPNESYAKALKTKAEEQMPGSRITIKPHEHRMSTMPSFGTMSDVQYFLNKNGISPETEEGKRIINAYRAMSPLMSSLIEAQNIAGYKVDYKSIVEAMADKAKSTVGRSTRLDYKDLRELLPNIKDPDRANVAFKYIDALSSPEGDRIPVLETGKNFVYYSALANKPTYIAQNVLEPLWALARVGKIKSPGKFMLPLGKEYVPLVERAQKEGILKQLFKEDMSERSLLNKLDILGNGSEQFSSKMSFEIGLRRARDVGLKGDEAYRHAYQFLFNEAKPFYNKANTMTGLLDKSNENINRYGMIFLRWGLDFIDKTIYGNPRTWIKTAVTWSLMAGFGNMPFGKQLATKAGIRTFKENPREWDMMDKFIAGGVVGLSGVDPKFLTPLYYKGLGELGKFTNSLFMLADQAKRADMNWKKYGTPGLVGSLPLAGLQYPILGITKAQKGIIERKGQQRRILYRPQTLPEKVITGVGLTTTTLGELQRRKYEGKP